MKLLALLLLFLAPLGASAASSFEIDSITDRHQVTAQRTLYHSREGVYEAFGNVVVSAKGQRLSCDYLWIDEKSREMKARGNVIFVDAQSTIQAAEVNFNLDTGFGSIFYGKVSNERYSLRGQLIRKVAPDRFLTTEGEYTTCRDCAESWKLAAKNVDLTVDGYAFMNGVFIKIKDIPTLYLPYLVVPVKTKRQTGLLFPRIGALSTHGFVFVQPLFIAISEHQDATIGLGRYTSRGARYEFEHRFSSYGGSGGNFTFFHTKDRLAKPSGVGYPDQRTAITANHSFPLHDHLALRWRVYEVFDRDYPIDFSEDIIGRGLPVLESNVITNIPFDDFFLSVEAKRYRNLLNEHPTGFDGGTVQALPTIHAGIKERTIFGPIMGSLYGRYDVFKRHNGSYQDSNRNRIYDPGTDTIREANRLILQPTFSAPFRLGSFLSLSPSVMFNETSYRFDVPTAQGSVPKTETQYVQAKLEASTVFEKVIDYDGEKVKRLKHQLIPFMTFSNIPWISEGKTGHPFNGPLGQVEGSQSGIFDQFDVVPLTNDTNFLRFPLGKSIFYGFTSRLIRKLRDPSEPLPRAYPFDQLARKEKKYPKPLNRKMEIEIEEQKLWDKFNPRFDQYQEIWTVNVSQAYDFKSAEHLQGNNKKRAFSYLLAKSELAVDQFTHNLEYRYFRRIVTRVTNPTTLLAEEKEYGNKHYLSNSFSWQLKTFQNFRKTRSFQRAISGGFTVSPQPNLSRTANGTIDWSFNDLVNVTAAYNFDLLANNTLSWGARTTLTHSSECWGLQFSYDWQRARTPQRSEFGFQLLLNLMGTGFMGSEGIQENGPAGVFSGM